MHRPRAVAQMPAQLAEDRRHRERRERIAALRVIALERLEQADRGDLQQVVERLGRMAVARREAARERQIALEQRVALGLAARAAEARELKLTRAALDPAVLVLVA